MTNSLLALVVLATILWSLSSLHDPGGNKKRWILTGFCLGWILQDVINPAGNAALGASYLWKYSIAIPTTILVILWFSGRKGRVELAAFALAVVGLISFFANFRSHGGICLVSAGLLLAIHFPRTIHLSTLLRNVTRISILSLFMLPLMLIPKLIDSGFFGETVQQKNLQQGQLGPWFLVGRTEPALSYSIIREHPFVGWGNISNVPGEIVRNGADLLRSAGFVDVSHVMNAWYRNGEQVILHSILAQYWVEAGVLSIVFFLVMGCYAWRAAFRADRYWMPVLVFFAFQFFWDLLFSPYTYRMVSLWGLMFVIIITVAQSRQSAYVRRAVH